MVYLDYIIGINHKLLIQLEDVFKITIDEDQDSVEFYGKDKKLLFFTNKMSVDFICKWDSKEDIPENLQKLYEIPKAESSEDEPNPSEEPTEEGSTQSVENPTVSEITEDLNTEDATPENVE